MTQHSVTQQVATSCGWAGLPLFISVSVTTGEGSGRLQSQLLWGVEIIINERGSYISLISIVARGRFL